MNKWIIQHPVQFGVMGTRKLLNFMGWHRKAGVWPLWYQWTPGHFDDSRAPTEEAQHFFRECSYIAYFVILHAWLLSIFAWVFSYRNLSRDSKMLLFVFLCIFIFWFAEHMIIYAYRKYRYPLEPLMLIISCQTWFFIRNHRLELFNQTQKLYRRLSAKKSS